MLPDSSAYKVEPTKSLSKSDNFLPYRLEVFHLLHPPPLSPPFNYLASFFFIKLLEIQTEQERSHETPAFLWQWKHLQKASDNNEKITLKIHILWLCPIKYTSCNSIPLKHTSCDSVPLNMSERFLSHVLPFCFSWDNDLP